MKRFLALFITALIIMCCTITAFAAENKQRVYDKAGLFTSEEAADIEKELNETVDEIGMDFVILTTSDKEGASLRDYADDFYDQGGFGTDSDGSGLIMLIDMEDRTVYMSTKGTAIRYLTDERIARLTDGNDEMYGYLADGEYEDAAEAFIDGVRYYVSQGIPSDQYNYDEETGAKDYYEPQNSLTFFEILLSILVPGLVAFLYVNNIKREYAMKAEKANANNYALAYRESCAFAFAVNTDDMISHNVTTRIIPRASSNSGSDSGRSTTHMSGGGSIHGGGGGGRHF